MNRVFIVMLCLLTGILSNAQSTTRNPLSFDLSKIGMVLDGQQTCNDTNARLQDIPSATMDQIIAAGPQSVPVLTRMLADRHMAQTREPILCYWPGMTISDIAFCLLTSLFMDTHGKTTVPGAAWNDMLGPNDTTAWDQLHSFIKKHGIRALQAKWQRLWSRYGNQMEWDPKEGCFKLKVSK